MISLSVEVQLIIIIEVSYRLYVHNVIEIGIIILKIFIVVIDRAPYLHPYFVTKLDNIIIVKDVDTDSKISHAPESWIIPLNIWIVQIGPVKVYYPIAIG